MYCNEKIADSQESVGYNESMIALAILCGALGVLLVLVTAMQPTFSSISQFELKRRQKNGDDQFAREQLLADVVSLQTVLIALLLVIFVAVSVSAFGWIWGIVVSVVVALEYGALARLDLVKKYANKLYVVLEPRLLFVAQKLQKPLALIRGVQGQKPYSLSVGSRDELEHIIKESGTLLTNDEKQRITHGLSFSAKTVADIMTPRTVIEGVNRDEVLGPLVLDDLHKTGHSRFPVIENDIDHVVGMLYVRSLLALDKKKTPKASDAMDPQVFYIHKDQNLTHALAAFLRTKHHLFIVVNEYRETVGVLSLEDVLEALIGKKIIDEFDAHDDLRAVAAQNPRKNNSPKKHHDI